MDDMIRIFQVGECTSIDSTYEEGRIVHEGGGRFLPETFSSLDQAKQFCDQLLSSDPSSVLYLVKDEGIIETVRDEAWHRAKERRSNVIYGAISSLFVALFAIGVSIGVFSFETVWGHVFFIAGITGFYILLLIVQIATIFEAIFLVIVAMLIVALFRGVFV